MRIVPHLIPSFVCVGLAAASCTPAQQKATSEVKLCDNHTKVDIDENMPRTRDNGQQIANELMAQWKLANPGTNWEMSVRRSHPIPRPFDNRYLIRGEQGQTYSNYSERDVLQWERETERMVLLGASVFHDAQALGSTVAVSCDMCHPDAANTHPETYPKFQVQLGRVVLMRDMINWCPEHPVRAPPMAADDPRMRAMEAYILARRKGVTLDYGKH